MANGASVRSNSVALEVLFTRDGEPLKFFLQDSVQAAERERLRQYIPTHGGRIVEKVPVEGYILYDARAPQGKSLAARWNDRPGRRHVLHYTFADECIRRGRLVDHKHGLPGEPAPTRSRANRDIILKDFVNPKKLEPMPLTVTVHSSIERGSHWQTCERRRLCKEIEDNGGFYVMRIEDARIVIAQDSEDGHEDFLQLQEDVRYVDRWIESPRTLREWITKKEVKLSPVQQTAMGGRPPRRPRTEYTADDDIILVEALARIFPNRDHGGRSSTGWYEAFANHLQRRADELDNEGRERHGDEEWEEKKGNEEDAAGAEYRKFLHASKHSHQSWRNHYKDNKEDFDGRISQFLLSHAYLQERGGEFPAARGGKRKLAAKKRPAVRQHRGSDAGSKNEEEDELESEAAQPQEEERPATRRRVQENEEQRAGPSRRVPKPKRVARKKAAGRGRAADGEQDQPEDMQQEDQEMETGGQGPSTSKRDKGKGKATQQDDRVDSWREGDADVQDEGQRHISRQLISSQAKMPPSSSDSVPPYSTAPPALHNQRPAGPTVQNGITVDADEDEDEVDQALEARSNGSYALTPNLTVNDPVSGSATSGRRPGVPPPQRPSSSRTLRHDGVAVQAELAASQSTSSLQTSTANVTPTTSPNKSNSSPFAQMFNLGKQLLTSPVAALSAQAALARTRRSEPMPSTASVAAEPNRRRTDLGARQLDSTTASVPVAPEERNVVVAQLAELHGVSETLARELLVSFGDDRSMANRALAGLRQYGLPALVDRR